MNPSNRRTGDRRKTVRGLLIGTLAALASAWGGPVSAAVKLSWVDDVVQEVIAEAKVGGRSVVREATGEPTRAAVNRGGRLFLRHEADEGVEGLIRGSDELARSARRVEQPSEALLQARFSRVLRHDPEVMRTFSSLAPAEKRVVVELSEAAQSLAKRYPARAETMVKELGPEGDRKSVV